MGYTRRCLFALLPITSPFFSSFLYWFATHFILHTRASCLCIQYTNMQLYTLLAAAASARLVAALPNYSHNTTATSPATLGPLCDLDWLNQCLDDCSTAVDLRCKRECYRSTQCDETRPNKTLQTRLAVAPTPVDEGCDEKTRNECLGACDENDPRCPLLICLCKKASGCGVVCEEPGPQLTAVSLPGCDEPRVCLGICRPYDYVCSNQCFDKHSCPPGHGPPTPTPGGPPGGPTPGLSARALTSPPSEALETLIRCMYHCDPRQPDHSTCVQTCAISYAKWPEPAPLPEPEPTCDPQKNHECMGKCTKAGRY